MFSVPKSVPYKLGLRLTTRPSAAPPIIVRRPGRRARRIGWRRWRGHLCRRRPRRQAGRRQLAGRRRLRLAALLQEDRDEGSGHVVRQQRRRLEGLVRRRRRPGRGVGESSRAAPAADSGRGVGESWATVGRGDGEFWAAPAARNTASAARNRLERVRVIFCFFIPRRFFRAPRRVVIYLGARRCDFRSFLTPWSSLVVRFASKKADC